MKLVAKNRQLIEDLKEAKARIDPTACNVYFQNKYRELKDITDKEMKKTRGVIDSYIKGIKGFKEEVKSLDNTKE